MDSEQYMMIEDLYKTVDKLNKHIESMALNKVNIEFLRKQMDKVLIDIEALKDANRDMKYNGNGSYSSMIETVVALLMIVNNEIKEHRIQTEGMAQCLRGKTSRQKDNTEKVLFILA